MKEKVKQDDREKRGVKAIKFLQGMVNIQETDAQSIRGWSSMSQHEQDFTLEFFSKVKGQS